MNLGRFADQREEEFQQTREGTMRVRDHEPRAGFARDAGTDFLRHQERDGPALPEVSEIPKIGEESELGLRSDPERCNTPDLGIC
jgi:hypothetical protein